MSFFVKLVDKANCVGKWICYSTVTVMTVMIVLQVLFRYVIQSSLSFSEELARYMFIWSAFMGAAMALKKRSHVSIEIAVANLPKKLKRGAIVIANALSFVFYSLLVIFGIVMVVHTMDQTSPALGLSMAFVYLAVPLAGIILLLNLVVNGREEYLHPEIIKSEGVE